MVQHASVTSSLVCWLKSKWGGSKDRESRTDDLWPERLHRKNGTRVVRTSIILSSTLSVLRGADHSPKMNHVTLRTGEYSIGKNLPLQSREQYTHEEYICRVVVRNNNNLGMSEVVAYRQLISIRQQQSEETYHKVSSVFLIPLSHLLRVIL